MFARCICADVSSITLCDCAVFVLNSGNEYVGSCGVCVLVIFASNCFFCNVTTVFASKRYFAVNGCRFFEVVFVEFGFDHVDNNVAVSVALCAATGHCAFVCSFYTGNAADSINCRSNGCFAGNVSRVFRCYEAAYEIVAATCARVDRVAGCSTFRINLFYLCSVSGNMLKFAFAACFCAMMVVFVIFSRYRKNQHASAKNYCEHK